MSGMSLASQKEVKFWQLSLLFIYVNFILWSFSRILRLAVSLVLCECIDFQITVFHCSHYPPFMCIGYVYLNVLLYILRVVF